MLRSKSSALRSPGRGLVFIPAGAGTCKALPLQLPALTSVIILVNYKNPPRIYPLWFTCVFSVSRLWVGLWAWREVSVALQFLTRGCSHPGLFHGCCAPARHTGTVEERGLPGKGRLVFLPKKEREAGNPLGFQQKSWWRVLESKGKPVTHCFVHHLRLLPPIQRKFW